VRFYWFSESLGVAPQGVATGTGKCSAEYQAMDLSFLTNADTLKLAASVLALGAAALSLWNTLSSRRNRPLSPVSNHTLILVDGDKCHPSNPLFKKI
jgi:hypothetical protein